jgi:hypothetical protein
MHKSGLRYKQYYLSQIHNVISDGLALMYFVFALYLLFIDFEYPSGLFYFPMYISVFIHFPLAIFGIGLCLEALINKSNIYIILLFHIIYTATAWMLLFLIIRKL